MALYSIVDIETTGSRPGPNTITEVAVIVTDGFEVKSRYETLLRPSGPIPVFVQRLTGITNEMTDDAPEFDEVAEELMGLLKDTVFVAHNVNFDYSFLKSEFGAAGIDWRSQRLCTVKMTRHFYPGLGKYNLGFLCNYFEIDNQAAHRAMGDCEATFKIFSSIVERFGEAAVEAFFKKQNKAVNMPQSLRPDLIKSIPSVPGIYYFRNASGRPIYIGKAVNLASRVRSHFNSGTNSARKQAFIRDIAEIDFELCGNALVAAILEDREIKKHRPVHNKAQREIITSFGIFPYTDGTGMQRLAIETLKKGGFSEVQFHSQSAAKAWLHKFALKFSVPPKQLGLPSLWSPTSDDLPESQNLHRDFRLAASSKSEVVFKGKGRSEDEMSWVRWISNESVTVSFVDRWGQNDDLESIWDSGQIIGLNATLDAILDNAAQLPHKWGVQVAEIKRTAESGS